MLLLCLVLEGLIFDLFDNFGVLGSNTALRNRGTFLAVSIWCLVISNTSVQYAGLGN